MEGINCNNYYYYTHKFDLPDKLIITYMHAMITHALGLNSTRHMLKS